MVDSSLTQILDEDTITILRCPVTRSKLKLDGGFLVAEVGGLRYPVRDGVPVLMAEEAKLPPGFESLDSFRKRFGIV